MDNRETDEVRDFWNRVADDWQIQVGAAGDSNRVLNSDPVLWAFAGDVGGLKVLDAGCGTGYLSRQLSDRGAAARGDGLDGAIPQVLGRQLHPARRAPETTERRIVIMTDLVITRIFDAPREMVYRAFVDPDQMAAWFGPVGWSVPRDTVDVDVRTGGHQRFTMIDDKDPSRTSPVNATFA